MDANLVRRIAFAAVAIPVAVGLVWLGGWPLAALVALIGVLGTRELFDIAAKQGILAFRGTGLAAAAIGPLLVYHVIADEPARVLFAANWMFVAAAFMLLE